MKTSELDASVEGGSLQDVVRPKTRGELRDRLAAGETCEVAEHVSEMTAIMLAGWLNFAAFTTEKSSHEGWMLFRPNHE